LAQIVGIDQNTVKNMVKEYRKTYPERFKEYISKSNNLREYYSPELCKAIQEVIKSR
jgi:hypothetical protein